MHNTHCLRGTCRWRNILPRHSKRWCMIRTSPWDLMGCTLQVLRELSGVIANLLQLSLKGCGDWPRFLHNVRKHIIPIFMNSKKEDSGNWTLSVPPWLWGMWWRKYLKKISRYLRWCLGVVSTNSQQRKSCLTNLTAFYGKHLTGWGDTNGQGPRQPDPGGLLQQGGIREYVLQRLIPASAIQWLCKMYLWHC